MREWKKEALSFSECSYELDNLSRLFNKEVEFPGKKGGGGVRYRKDSDTGRCRKSENQK